MADVMLDSNSPSQRQYILVLAPIFSKDLPWLSDFAIEMNNYSLYYSGGWKIQKMVKISWLSVKKMCIWCEKFQKKFGLNWRFPWRAPAKTCSLGFGSAICPLHVICKAICGPKKFHPVCLTFDPLGLQMTTIAQNDWNLLRILNFWVKNFF